jgi:hypothetical protein
VEANAIRPDHQIISGEVGFVVGAHYKNIVLARPGNFVYKEIDDITRKSQDLSYRFIKDLWDNIPADQNPKVPVYSPKAIFDDGIDLKPSQPNKVLLTRNPDESENFPWAIVQVIDREGVSAYQNYEETKFLTELSENLGIPLIQINGVGGTVVISPS